MPNIKAGDAIPAGSYRGTLTGVREELKKDYGFGVNDYFHFDFLVEGPDEDKKVNVMSTQKYSKKAKARTIIEGIAGVPLENAALTNADGDFVNSAGEVVTRLGDMDQIIGKPVLVALIVDENGFNKVTSVMPAPTTRNKREVPA